MKNQFWKLVKEIKEKQCYFSLYELHIYQLKNILSISMMILSLVSTSLAVILEDSATVFFALLALSGQIIQHMLPYFRFSEKLSAFQYFNLEIADLYQELEDYWYKLDFEDLNEEVIFESFKSFRHKYHHLETKYLHSLNLTEKKRLSKEADNWRNNYFNFKFYLTGDNDEPKTAESN